MSVAKKILVVGLLSLSTAVLYAQDWFNKPAPKDAKALWNTVKADKSNYIWGEGRGGTLEEADQNALVDLISKISVSVESEFDLTETENFENGDMDARTAVLSKVNTYSSATLTNTDRVILSNEPDACVGRYIKRSELNRLFSERLVRVKEYARYARKAIEARKVDDALRYYYWSLMLLQSVPHSATETYVTEDGDEVVLSSWLPICLDAILDDLNVSFLRRDGCDAVLSFTYRGEPVTSLDYTYFDGRDWSNIYSAKDGVGVVELPSGVDVPQIQIRYETIYKSQAHIDKDVESVLNSQKMHVVKSAYCTVPLSRTAPVIREQRKIEKAAAVEMAENASHFELLRDDRPYSRIMERIVYAIKTKNYEAVENCFTPEGYQMYKKLVAYGNASILDENSCRYYNNFAGKVVARSLKMSFSFSKGVRKSFVEDIVFTYGADKKIECVAFGLGNDALKDIISNDFWNDTTKVTLVEFLENYKTAYSLKRLDYLESIFDDSAVIIVGHVARKITAPEVRGMDYGNSTVVTRRRYSKERYMKNLAACFASNEFVNIRFANNEIRKYGVGGETYGIQIKQDYYSTNYGDSGYLFLMVDLNEPTAPVIKVRTWQEYSVPTDQLVSINDF